MKKKEYEQLISNARDLYQEKRLKEEYEYNTGKYFNVFHVFGKSNDEVNIHSRFLAMLLDPNGTHGCGTIFLKKFLKNIGLFKNELNLVTAKVYSEYDIGLLSDDGENGGRLDILIKFGSEYAIIIENKIDAYDQENQLLRYKNYAEKVAKYSHFDILYLTKDGHNPDLDCDDSYWKNISYANNIIPWLRSSLKNPINKKTNIVSTIKQYISTLNEILELEDEEESSIDLGNLLTENNNAVLIDDIAKIIDEVKESILETFFSEYAKNNLTSLTSNIEYENSDSFRRLYCTRRNWKFYIVIELNIKDGILKHGIIRRENNSQGNINGNTLNSIRDRIRRLPNLSDQRYKKKHSWWIIWNYFEDDYEYWTTETYLKIKNTPEDLFSQIYNIVDSYIKAFKPENFFNN